MSNHFAGEFRFSKVRAGVYSAMDSEARVFTLRKHDGLTWQDRPYWLLYIDDALLTREGGTRGLRFRTLADAKAHAATLAR